MRTVVIRAIALSTAAAGASFVLAVPAARSMAIDILRNAGLLDAPDRPAEAIDLVLDISANSSGLVPGNYTQTIEALLARMSSAPRSALRIIIQGEDALDAAIIASVTSGAPAKSSKRARASHIARFQATARELLITKAEPFLKEVPPRQSSPIAGTIGWVGMLSLPPGLPSGAPRHIVYIGDAREVSSDFGDFECGPLPTPGAFTEELRKRGVLASGSLQDVQLHFTYTEPRPVARRKCPPMTIARAKRIQDLWTAAGMSAGVRAVIFHTHAIVFDPNGSEESP